MATDNDFQLADDFQGTQASGGLGLGVLESQYQELFAEALEDGVITEDERQRLEKAAENLGLDVGRLGRLEEAMTAAYETHHRIRVVDQSRPQKSLAPLAAAPPPSVPAKPASAGADSAAIAALQAENSHLKQRIAALEQELERAQSAVNVEVDLGDLEMEAAETQSPEDAWKRVRRAPSDAEAHRALYDAYDAAGNADGRFLAAQALVALGEASYEQVALVKENLPQGLSTPHAAIDESLWHGCLYHPDEDAVTGAIFSVVAPAILIGRVTTLRRDGQLPQLEEATLQDPGKSTVMAVRAIAWGAALLGLPVPPIHAVSSDPGAYSHVPAVPPVTKVGKGALSGRSAPELAFLVGRHLSGYRGEHFVRTLFTATEDLEDLFLAALLIANPKLPISGAPRARIEPLARAIAPLLEAPQQDALRGHYLRFAEEGGRTNLQRWSAGAERTAARAGLALAQNLGAALGVLEAEEGPRGPVALDLLAYSTSAPFLRLRRALGLHLS